MFLTTAYSILLFSKVCFGMCKGDLSRIIQHYLSDLPYNDEYKIDLVLIEIIILSVLLFFTILLGIYPFLIFEPI